jgi:hypothetical protein
MKAPKRFFYFSIFIAVTIACSGIFVFFGETKNEVVPLLCHENIFDLGRIPVRGSEAVKIHNFKIYNNTDNIIGIKEVAVDCPCATVFPLGDIPAKGMRELKVRFHVPRGDLMRHSARILVIPRDEKIPPLRMEIAGGADFSSYLSHSVLDFGECYFGESKIKTFEVYCASEKPFEEIVKEIDMKDPHFSVSPVCESERTPQELYDGTKYYLHKRKIEVILLGRETAQMCEGTEKMRVLFSDGDVQTINVLWKLKEKPVFSKEIFYLIGVKPREERNFTVIYNSDIGGTPRSIKTFGEGLSILKTEEEGESILVGVKYISTMAGELNKRLGEIVVESEGGKRHVLPVIAL